MIQRESATILFEYRVRSISAERKKYSDIMLSVPKTKVLHICRQDSLTATTQKEMKWACEFICKYINYDHNFLNSSVLNIHQAWNSFHRHYVVEKIVDFEGPVLLRKFLIKWYDYNNSYNSWESHSNIEPSLIKMFECLNYRMGITNCTIIHGCITTASVIFPESR